MSILISEKTFLILEKRKPSHEKLYGIAKAPVFAKGLAIRVVELRIALQSRLHFAVLIT
jgi:hypothetical protein